MERSCTQRFRSANGGDDETAGLERARTVKGYTVEVEIKAFAEEGRT